MYRIISKLEIPCIFIRYNPDSNKNTLLEKIQRYLHLDEEIPWDDYGFYSEYLFYEMSMDQLEQECLELGEKYFICNGKIYYDDLDD